MQLCKTRLCFAILVLALLTACKTSDRRKDSSAVSNADSPVDVSNQAVLMANDYVVPKNQFSKKTIDSLVTRRRDEVDRLASTEATRCSTAESLAKRLVTRLTAANGLDLAVRQTPSLDVGIACNVRGVKLTEIKAGLIWVYPDFLSGLATEDHLAAILAHEIIHYTRAHEEDQEAILESWMPFRENALNRARWEQEKEADRLAPRLLEVAGFDPEAAREIAILTDKIMSSSPDWKPGQINFPMDSATDRSMRIQIEIKQRKLKSIPQTVGEMPAAKAQIAAKS